jgi:hypothetical protein
MLSRDDDELLTRTGPGTAMGALLRRYWIPVLQSSELSPGGRVKRVQLLGERLIAYRTSSGAPGVIGEFCPHRGASLYFGRVEEGHALRLPRLEFRPRWPVSSNPASRRVELCREGSVTRRIRASSGGMI